MYDLFFQKFNEKVPLTDAEEQQIRRYLMPKKLRKNQYLLQEGDPCQATAFVEKGALRQYSLDETGNIHIVQFAIEGWTISDLYSFLSGEQSTYNIDALENCELVLIDKPAHETLLRTMPKYETYTRLQITGAYLAMQRRLTAIFSLSLEERYTEFTRLYASIVQRVPQHMVASYLGLQPETLSRLRKRMSSH